MKTEVLIELENGQKVHSLFDNSELPNIDKNKDVVFFLSDGKIIVGRSDGEIITVDCEDGSTYNTFIVHKKNCTWGLDILVDHLLGFGYLE